MSPAPPSIPGTTRFAGRRARSPARVLLPAAVVPASAARVEDWRLLAVGALIAVFSGATTYALQKRIDRRAERVTGGRIEILRRLHTERFEAARLLEGLLAELEHDISHIRRGDVEYLELGRAHCRMIRVESRARVAVIGDEVREALEQETDAAIAYFDRVDAGDRRAMPTSWWDAQLNRKEVLLRVMRELRL